MSEVSAAPIPARAPPGASGDFLTTFPAVRAWGPGRGRLPVILFAEDEDSIREATTKVLEIAGFEVIACPDAQTAVQVPEACSTIDMLLTDYDLPGMTGLELARRVTTLRPALPTVLLCGSVLPEEIHQELEERQWRFLAKPCRPPVLLATLHSLLAGQQGWVDSGP